MTQEIECPVCGEAVPVEIEDVEDTLNSECVNCGASLEISYTVSIEIDDVSVIEASPVSFDCPKCDNSLELSGISEESGSEEIECDSCHSLLDLSWNDWGEDIDIVVLEEGEEDEEAGENEEEMEEVVEVVELEEEEEDEADDLEEDAEEADDDEY